MTRTPASQNFFAKLPSFSDFGEFTNDAHFVRPPDDWFIVIADVKGSTRAIDEGRYKDVNTIGAASVSVVTNLLDDDIPYFFGGDGVTLLAPPEHIERILKALQLVQRLSRRQFRMELVVGRITVGEVGRDGHVVEVARHELASGQYAAVFRGSGFEEAERRIKANESRYCGLPAASSDAEEQDLRHLSCHWNSLPSKRGLIMSLLVKTSVDRPIQVYKDLLDSLSGIFDDRLEEASPVDFALTQCKGFGGLWSRKRLYENAKWVWPTGAMRFMASIRHTSRRLSPAVFGRAGVRKAVRPAADHRKFDGMLRMVLDCSTDQVFQIRAFLEARRVAGDLCYGIHISSRALLTCYAQGSRDTRHIHFIDGAEGGYAMAARQLKQQLAANLRPKPKIVDIEEPRPVEKRPKPAWKWFASR